MFSLLSLSGLTGAAAFICSLASVSFMPVPDALSIIFACPVVTILLSAVMLRDRLNLVKVVAASLLLGGVVMVCKPPFIFDSSVSTSLEARDDLYYVGVLLASAACLATGMMDVVVAKCSEVSTTVLVLWTAMVGLVVSVIYCLTTPSSHILSEDITRLSWQTWATYLGEILQTDPYQTFWAKEYFSCKNNSGRKKYLSGLAVSGLLAFTTLTKSLQLISPNLVASLRTLELVLAFLVQSLITGLSPDLLSWLGGLLILTGVLLLALQDLRLGALTSLVNSVKEQLRRQTFGREEEERAGLLLSL